MGDAESAAGAQRDPLSMTLREAVAACGDGDHEEDVSFEDFSRERPPQAHISAAFEDVHPAAAATLIRRIAQGLEDGYTVQGVAHPDFQHAVDLITVEEADG